QIKTVEETRALIAQTGYHFCADFPLPLSAWWDEYYIPMLARLPAIREQYLDTLGSAEFFAGIEQEIEVHRNHPGEYGYQFFLLRAPA
ncbi:MAG: SAM-dependent methyltransferase, partial [Methanoregula sp.]